MKKIIRVLSLILAFAMLALSLASCGVTDEARVSAAMLKMMMAKRVDSTADIKLTMSSMGVTYETVMKAVIKTDTTKADNPKAYMSVSATVFGETESTETFYKDGYLYTDSSGSKIKREADYSAVMGDSANVIDILDIFDIKKTNVDDNFTITRNGDGTLTVKMLVTKEELAEGLDSFTEELAKSLGTSGSVNVSNTVFEYTVDKGNNISDISASMEMEIIVQGKKISIVYEMDFKYNSIGKGFEVPVPEDESEYISSGR